MVGMRTYHDNRNMEERVTQAEPALLAFGLSVESCNASAVLGCLMQ